LCLFYHFIKPNQQEEGTDFDANTPNNDEELIDVELENAIVKLFMSKTSISTKDIVDKLKDTYDKSIDKVCIMLL
jgi:hypothetical protein